MDNAKITLTTAELLKAKENVRYLLDNAMASVDMKGIAYWAAQVEKLREELRNLM